MARTPKEPIPESLRWEIWERDNFTCHYCGARKFLSIDHKIPENHGGTLDANNLVTACTPCNSRKRTKAYERFRMESDVERAGEDYVTFRDHRANEDAPVVRVQLKDLEVSDALVYMGDLFGSRSRKAFHWRTELHHNYLAKKFGMRYRSKAIIIRMIRHMADAAREGASASEVVRRCGPEYKEVCEGVWGDFGFSYLMTKISFESEKVPLREIREDGTEGTYWKPCNELTVHEAIQHINYWNDRIEQARGKRDAYLQSHLDRHGVELEKHLNFDEVCIPPED
jgi:hypothetical protein